ncbi:Iron sulphur-containing domain, CDGSH-type, subfamily and Iron sulphur-containing domain, CDGSH-type-containing protein [Strongyloides ratti]|uniref:Iron sulphur-containing domain, CDGSH-type, subfamily and Iron sulphur-containing domain, CDGSH-type-containing protein n=1 Tax=Strongyloides ratti TaxID=34506 RepID=A0A090LGU4_STRRB|nr:Iron sulphur-containing domain, CDGSH-type, subfamily and Iron sulphur-containing domain, CDGSH-type-containing protein [Strongyloides ratti]CEF67348.1 Iron sulphur-containing domain, CDGSH-type, subfamily and Iron sulphur-containing domain, CDGSH-type-containing protein [Strongyloides ratti]
MSNDYSFSHSKTNIIILSGGMIALGAVIGYIFGTCTNKSSIINHSIKKKTDKVVDIIDIEDLKIKNTLCRCWKSKDFPYCDGSHNKHNSDSKDNLGPIIIKEK